MDGFARSLLFPVMGVPLGRFELDWACIGAPDPFGCPWLALFPACSLFAAGRCPLFEFFRLLLLLLRLGLGVCCWGWDYALLLYINADRGGRLRRRIILLLGNNLIYAVNDGFEARTEGCVQRVHFLRLLHGGSKGIVVFTER